MPYSTPLMTLIFNKLSFAGARATAGGPRMSRRAHRHHRKADMWTDVQRLGFRAQPSERTYPGNTYVSTPKLCNANFASRLA